MGFSEFYDYKNIGFAGKVLIVLSIFNILSSIPTISFDSPSMVLSFFALQLFYNACCLPIIYCKHEENIKEIGTDYIQYIVLPTYVFVLFGFFLGFQAFEGSIHLFMSYISFSAYHIYLAFFILNLYCPTLYFFYVYLKYKDIPPVLIFTMVCFVGTISGMWIGKIILKLF